MTRLMTSIGGIRGLVVAVATVGLALGSAGCFDEDIIFDLALQARRGPEIRHIKKVAVLGLKYKEDASIGRELAANLVTKLSNAKPPPFKLAERGQIERVVKELNLGATGYVEDAQAVEIGKMLGVDAVILGNVQAYDGRQVTLFLQREGSVVMHIRMVEVARSQVLLSEKCAGDVKGGGDSSIPALLAQAGDMALDQFVGAVADHTERVKRKFKAAANPLDSKTGLGIKYAKKGMELWDFSRTNLKAAYDANPNATYANNNWAIMLEQSGDMDGAYKCYMTAMAASPQDETVLNNVKGHRHLRAMMGLPSKPIGVSSPPSVPTPVPKP